MQNRVTKTGLRQLTAVSIALILAAGCSKTDEVARLTSEATQASARGDHDTAIARWTSALLLDSKNGQADLQRAALYEARGNWTNAMGDYTRFLALPTNNPGRMQQLPFLGNRTDSPQDLAEVRGMVF